MQRKHSILKTIHLSLIWIKTNELSLKTIELSLKTIELSLKTNSAFLQERLSIHVYINDTCIVLHAVYIRYIFTLIHIDVSTIDSPFPELLASNTGR